MHRFLDTMITNHDQIRRDSRVQVVVDMDGFGSAASKKVHYDWFVNRERVSYSGIKLFYQHDEPLMTPAETIELDPSPDVIIYQ